LSDIETLATPKGVKEQVRKALKAYKESEEGPSEAEVTVERIDCRLTFLKLHKCEVIEDDSKQQQDTLSTQVKRDD
jgi:hypothetical protein